MKRLIIGNWKMNLDRKESVRLFDNIKKGVKGIEVGVAPSYPFLSELKDRKGQVKLVAQNIYSKDEGAYTGEVSISMLRGLVDYVMVGHSERREYFGETDEEIGQKVKLVSDNKLKLVLCIGESFAERKDDTFAKVLKQQLEKGLAKAKRMKGEDIVVVYEPLWTISTGGLGIVPTEDELIEVTILIRKYLVKILGKRKSGLVRVLYGGSVTAKNVEDFVGEGKMDGALIGNASLKTKDFSLILKKVSQLD